MYELLASNGEHVAYILMNDDGGATIALANGDDYDLADEENAETTLQSMYQEINGDSDMEESVEEFAEEDNLEVAEEEVAEEEVEETVEVPVAALEELMQLAGYANYADKLAEYENEPEEEYMDAEDQLIGLSGGLNGPKKMHPAVAGGDNPMDQEPRKVEEEDTIESVEQSLYKSYKDFLEAQEIELDEEQVDEIQAVDSETGKIITGPNKGQTSKNYPNPTKDKNKKQVGELIQAVGSKDGKIITGPNKGQTSKSWLKNRDSKYDDAP